MMTPCMLVFLPVLRWKWLESCRKYFHRPIRFKLCTKSGWLSDLLIFWISPRGSVCDICQFWSQLVRQATNFCCSANTFCWYFRLSDKRYLKFLHYISFISYVIFSVVTSLQIEHWNLFLCKSLCVDKSSFYHALLKYKGNSENNLRWAGNKTNNERKQIIISKKIRTYWSYVST
jgi:hypothetical protein